MFSLTEKKIILRLLKKGNFAPCYKNFLASVLYRRYRRRFPFIAKKAIKRVRPLLETIPVRVSGRIYKVPAPIAAKRQYKISLKWLCESIQSRNESTLVIRIKKEILETSKGLRSGTTKLHLNHFQTLVGNRAFTNYRWK